MTADRSRHVTFFHSPQSRSGGVLMLLEDLAVKFARAAKIDADLLAARGS
jgi:hypothetical protein